MKNYYLRFTFLAIIFCLTVLTGCKDDDDDVEPKTKSEFLANGAWRLSAQTISPAYDWDNDGNTETDIFALGAGCDNDDVLIFKSDKTLSIEEGATKCNPNDPQVIGSGTWALTNNENTLEITAAGSSSPFIVGNITELNKNTLKYTESFEEDSVDYIISYTYVH